MAAGNKLLSASSAGVRVQLVQLLGGVLQSLPKPPVTWTVLSSLGGWRGWGGLSGDLLRCCCGQGAGSCVPARRGVEQERLALLEPAGGMSQEPGGARASLSGEGFPFG